MLKNLEAREYQINIKLYVDDFRKRYVNLLSYGFSTMDIALAIDILNPNLTTK